ncbi:hypothetical protein ACIQNU_14835 [Streptomyces sp. NPDC091292]|uniref:hypothetical protein n=1 Tax=Streptomyces sp. NPDC091292 TaxID=3365991 RepID=UPI003818A10F
MTKVFLTLHVLVAILAVGPIAVAASLFPRYARQLAPAAPAIPEETPTPGNAAGIAAFLHRICRGYAVFGIAVPVFGFATAAYLGVLTDIWLLVSIGLTGVAAVLLAMVILPNQQRVLAASGGAADGPPPPTASRLSMLTGVFNLLWAIVVVLMIIRPGSTTGA